MIENIEKLVSEDTLEMIDYLQSQKITGYEKVLEMLNDENEANNLSLFILEESKLYGGYAYKHSTFEVNLLEKNKEAIFEALKNRPELIIPQQLNLPTWYSELIMMSFQYRGNGPHSQ